MAPHWRARLNNKNFKGVTAEARSNQTQWALHTGKNSLIINEEIHHWLKTLVQACPDTNEIWLIGSRANKCARTCSDWDFLWFGSSNALSCLKSISEIHRDDVDFFIVDDTGNFKTAWGSEKKGSLLSWEWQRLSENVATYLSKKWVSHEESDHLDCNMGKIALAYMNAYRIWP
jgi:hypothetical protein